MPDLVSFGAGEKPLSLSSKAEWVFAALGTATVLTCSVAGELF